MSLGRNGASMRLVLDTNVVISGFFWRSHPRRLLDLGRDGSLSIFTSKALLVELANVLSREKWAAMLSARQTTPAYLVQRYASLALRVSPAIVSRVVPDDADDDQVIACALAAQADLIVSGDKHLHSLGGQYQGIKIITPAQAVQRIEETRG